MRAKLSVPYISAGSSLLPEGMSSMEKTATRKMIDCRKTPSEKNCSLTIAGTEEEVLMAATQHAISSHGHKDTPELRDEIRRNLETE